MKEKFKIKEGRVVGYYPPKLIKLDVMLPQTFIDFLKHKYGRQYVSTNIRKLLLEHFKEDYQDE